MVQWDYCKRCQLILTMSSDAREFSYSPEKKRDQCGLLGEMWPSGQTVHSADRNQIKQDHFILPSIVISTQILSPAELDTEAPYQARRTRVPWLQLSHWQPVN